MNSFSVERNISFITKIEPFISNLGHFKKFIVFDNRNKLQPSIFDGVNQTHQFAITKLSRAYSPQEHKRKAGQFFDRLFSFRIFTLIKTFRLLLLKIKIMPRFSRILLKLSGESLMGTQQYGIDQQRLTDYAEQIKEIAGMGVQVGIVIGGGNIFRGLSGATNGFDRVKGDQMGMLATVINSLALNSALQSVGCKSHVLTAIRMEPIGEFYSKDKAIEILEKGEVAIFSAGTGNPYFTTDTGSSLRGIEIEADVMLKGTRVDGIYTADPEKDPSATRFEKISFDEIYQRDLKVMDLTATAMCKENNLPIIVFNMDVKGNLKKVLEGENIGTYVHS